MGFFSKIANGVGSLMNGVTGSNSAAKLAQKYNLQSMAVTNKYQKEFAQNAHQWEAQDLQKAGYNPALTTGLGGASTGGAGGGTGASVSPAGLNPFDAVSTIGNLINSTSATKADINLKNAQAAAEPIKAKADLINANANERMTNSNITKNDKGGWVSFWGGNEGWKIPEKAKNFDNKMTQKIKNEKKNMTKREKEVTNKFDNWDY